MREDQDLTEFDELFSGLYKKMQDKEPDDEAMRKFHLALRDMLQLFATSEVHICNLQDPYKLAKQLAQGTLRCVDRRTDRAWAYNDFWKYAATHAELIVAKGATPERVKRFTFAMDGARKQEEKEKDK